MMHDTLNLLQRHMQVVMGLAARDIKTRYSTDFMGGGWALLAPAAWIGLLVIAFDVLGRTLPIHTDPISFILSGVIPYLVFRSSISAIARTRGHYRTLMVLAPVTRAHVGTALSLIELINALVLYGLVMGLNWAATGHFELHSVGQNLAALGLAWLFGFSLGSVFEELSRVHVVFGRLTPVLLRPFFMISGVFFTANEVPLNMLGYIDWNPLLHAIELMRESMFASYRSHVMDVPYLLEVNMALLVLAMLMRWFGREGRL
jgi:ABC-type polysaccharide/polyol phosphate export permease